MINFVKKIAEETLFELDQINQGILDLIGANYNSAITKTVGRVVYRVFGANPFDIPIEEEDKDTKIRKLTTILAERDPAKLKNALTEFKQPDEIREAGRVIAKRLIDTYSDMKKTNKSTPELEYRVYVDSLEPLAMKDPVIRDFYIKYHPQNVASLDPILGVKLTESEMKYKALSEMKTILGLASLGGYIASFAFKPLGIARTALRVGSGLLGAGYTVAEVEEQKEQGRSLTQILTDPTILLGGVGSGVDIYTTLKEVKKTAALKDLQDINFINKTIQDINDYLFTTDKQAFNIEKRLTRDIIFDIARTAGQQDKATAMEAISTVNQNLGFEVLNIAYLKQLGAPLYTATKMYMDTAFDYFKTRGFLIGNNYEFIEKVKEAERLGDAVAGNFMDMMISLRAANIVSEALRHGVDSLTILGTKTGDIKTTTPENLINEVVSLAKQIRTNSPIPEQHLAVKFFTPDGKEQKRIVRVDYVPTHDNFIILTGKVPVIVNGVREDRFIKETAVPLYAPEKAKDFIKLELEKQGVRPDEILWNETELTATAMYSGLFPFKLAKMQLTSDLKDIEAGIKREYNQLEKLKNQVEEFGIAGKDAELSSYLGVKVEVDLLAPTLSLDDFRKLQKEAEKYNLELPYINLDRIAELYIKGDAKTKDTVQNAYRNIFGKNYDKWVDEVKLLKPYTDDITRLQTITPNTINEVKRILVENGIESDFSELVKLANKFEIYTKFINADDKVRATLKDIALNSPEKVISKYEAKLKEQKVDLLTNLERTPPEKLIEKIEKTKEKMKDLQEMLFKPSYEFQKKGRGFVYEFETPEHQLNYLKEKYGMMLGIYSRPLQVMENTVKLIDTLEKTKGEIPSHIKAIRDGFKIWLEELHPNDIEKFTKFYSNMLTLFKPAIILSNIILNYTLANKLLPNLNPLGFKDFGKIIGREYRKFLYSNPMQTLRAFNPFTPLANSMLISLFKANFENIDNNPALLDDLARLFGFGETQKAKLADIIKRDPEGFAEFMENYFSGLNPFAMNRELLRFAGDNPLNLKSYIPWYNFIAVPFSLSWKILEDWQNLPVRIREMGYGKALAKPIALSLLTGTLFGAGGIPELAPVESVYNISKQIANTLVAVFTDEGEVLKDQTFTGMLLRKMGLWDASDYDNFFTDIGKAVASAPFIDDTLLAEIVGTGLSFIQNLSNYGVLSPSAGSTAFDVPMPVFNAIANIAGNIRQAGEVKTDYAKITLIQNAVETALPILGQYRRTLIGRELVKDLYTQKSEVFKTAYGLAEEDMSFLVGLGYTAGFILKFADGVINNELFTNIKLLTEDVMDEVYNRNTKRPKASDYFKMLNIKDYRTLAYRDPQLDAEIVMKVYENDEKAFYTVMKRFGMLAENSFKEFTKAVESRDIDTAKKYYKAIYNHYLMVKKLDNMLTTTGYEEERVKQYLETLEKVINTQTRLLQVNKISIDL